MNIDWKFDPARGDVWGKLPVGLAPLESGVRGFSVCLVIVADCLGGLFRLFEGLELGTGDGNMIVEVCCGFDRCCFAAWFLWFELQVI